jgi:hypothetical protein
VTCLIGINSGLSRNVVDCQVVEKGKRSETQPPGTSQSPGFEPNMK